MALHGFDAQEFLDQYWQQRPCLLKNALPDFHCPVDGNDLAGLACEEAVESRLIIEQDGDWALMLGPFVEADFARLPTQNWTLLVQSVDQWIPEVSALFAEFRFLPRWRTEDIMISYAVDGGNVGPHHDQYDVFLIQGAGQRRWQLGQRCDSTSPLRDNEQLRLLAEFHPTASFLLNPGDILYIPPGIAHWGHGIGEDCITLSVGFRAPSSAELLGHWADSLSDELGESHRYRDPKLLAQTPSAEIPDTVIAELRRQLSQKLDDDQYLRRWFGKLMTATQAEPPPVSEAFQQQALGLRLGARLAFDSQNLYADGEAFPYQPGQAAAVKSLCALEADDVVSEALRSALDKDLLAALLRTGTLECRE